MAPLVSRLWPCWCVRFALAPACVTGNVMRSGLGLPNVHHGKCKGYDLARCNQTKTEQYRPSSPRQSAPGKDSKAMCGRMPSNGAAIIGENTDRRARPAWQKEHGRKHMRTAQWGMTNPRLCYHRKTPGKTGQRTLLHPWAMKRYLRAHIECDISTLLRGQIMSALLLCGASA